MAFVIGIDFGSDSVRALLLDINGNEIAEAVHEYTRWADGKYCNPAENRFRQHPLDYIEGAEAVIKGVVSGLSDEEKKNVKGISVDTTGSTPVAVNREGRPLALTDGFEENPNAMFVLWKDHTAIAEAEEINRLADSWDGPHFTKYVGGIYSSEWFWAKMLHILRVDSDVREQAYSWAEHCDWITFELTGGKDVTEMKRSRCAAGHKAMWHEEFNGLPSENFLSELDPLLSGLRSRLYDQTETSDNAAGTLSPEWAERTGLHSEVIVGVGAFDAHMGAVGGEIEPYYLSKVMGTSTCDMLIAPPEDLDGKLIRGICGQVDGSIIPGMIGLEAGQSAFGDIYAWYKQLIIQPVNRLLDETDLIDGQTKKRLQNELDDNLIKHLSGEASKIEVKKTDPVALDWLNGRRTPDANQKLTTAIEGLNLSSSSAQIFKTLVEASCFGARAIVERFQNEGVPIKGVIGLGGVAKKSPYVMQTLADILKMPIRIVRSEQTCALGAGMFAATAAGLFSSVEEAKQAMGRGFEHEYSPREKNAAAYDILYSRYRSLGGVMEDRTEIKEN
ncbi:ribulokinase [Rhodohalobacter sp. SW132]|uniref:ribulokinase n=1 Tax=Rhodohalobacter sp. SW132 TaxID=2293433 RepID=UPI000E229990|nr:ribulokinase [Rhodohalobacter sp. SW132]REL37579.1 ribulokinase [Rhodohalobacter sp. SW132]